MSVVGGSSGTEASLAGKGPDEEAWNHAAVAQPAAICSAISN
jgi:hypothetical protein